MAANDGFQPRILLHLESDLVKLSLGYVVRSRAFHLDDGRFRDTEGRRSSTGAAAIVTCRGGHGVTSTCETCCVDRE